MTWPNLPEWLKISSTHVGAIALIGAALLFMPHRVLETVGATQFVDEYRMWIGFVLIAATAVLLARGIAVIGRYVRDRLRWRSKLHQAQKRLQDLTQGEAAILAGYVAQNTRTQYLSFSDGTVRGLESATILYRASEISAGGDIFPYNIQPWARTYLREHPDILGDAAH